MLKSSLLSLLMLTIILCGIYPVLTWGVGQLFFHHKANGSLVFDQYNQPAASTLIAQKFSTPRYFHPRPSAADYNGAHSTASNLGPTSEHLSTTLQQNSQKYRDENHLSSLTPLPVDAVTSSGSGLDPHITLENALLQLPRVAKARGISEEHLRTLLDKLSEGKTWGILGEKRINVMILNLELDNQ